MAKKTDKQEPRTEIEKELADAAGLLDRAGFLKLDADEKDDRQMWLKRLVTSVQEIEPDEWSALSQPAQEWYNAAVEEIEDDKDISEPDDEAGSGEAEEENNGNTEDTEDEEGGDNDGDDSDDSGEKEPEPAPRRRGAKAEEAQPARGRAAAKSEKAEAEPKRGSSKKGDAKATAEAKKGSSRREADSDDDKSAKKPRASSGGKPAGAQATIKRAIIENPMISMDDLVAAANKAGYQPTRIAISTIRSGMMQTLRIMKDMGKLKGVTLPP